jgi:RNA polymerase sigma-70 factor (ECF subfamily)
MVDELSPERRVSAWQEMRRVTQALNGLPPRCREVVWLRKVGELSTKEVAGHLGISERTVEGQLLKGMQLLTDAVLSHNVNSLQTEDAEGIDTDREHGE